MEKIIWQELDTVKKMRAWIDSMTDPDEAFERISTAYENKEKGLHQWVAAAIMGDSINSEFSNGFLAKRSDPELMANDVEYYEKIQEVVLIETRNMFKKFTGLDVVKDDRRAAGSEDVDISINDEGALESISDYWVMGSNDTFWNVSVEFYREGPSVVFEYVEGSYEELRS
jgi:hypothetical protein